MVFIFQFVNVVYYIDWFVNIEGRSLNGPFLEDVILQPVHSSHRKCHLYKWWCFKPMWMDMRQDWRTGVEWREKICLAWINNGFPLQCSMGTLNSWAKLIVIHKPSLTSWKRNLHIPSVIQSCPGIQSGNCWLVFDSILSAYIQVFSSLTPNCLMASHFPALLSLSSHSFSSPTSSLVSMTLSFASPVFFPF